MQNDADSKRKDREALVQVAIIAIGFIAAMLILAYSYASAPMQILNVYSTEDAVTAAGSQITQSVLQHQNASAPQESSPVSLPPQVPQQNSVNINTADQSQLSTLPGIGPVLAERIIQFREQYGTFSNVEELKSVSGIGDKTFENLRDYITVG